MKASLGLGGRFRLRRRNTVVWRFPAWVARLGPRWILAILLGLVLLVELLLPGGGEVTLPPASSLPKESGTIVPANVQGWTRVILARPLFNPDRRPSGKVAGGEEGLPRLSAILIGHGLASAIFTASGQKPLVVQPGGFVGGDRVQSISADEVVMLTPAGAVTLRPRFANSAAAATSAQTINSPEPAAPPANPQPPSAAVSPKTGQPLDSSVTAGPYDNE